MLNSDDSQSRMTATTGSDFYDDYNILEDEPGYMQHTLTSSALPSRQEELERVKASFRTGSYLSVKKLPKCLHHGEILLSQKDIIASNMMSGMDTFKPPSSKNENFNHDRYIGSDYDIERISKQLDLDNQKLFVDAQSRKPFKISSRRRGLTEDCIYDPSYKFPSLGPGGDNLLLQNITRQHVSVDNSTLSPGKQGALPVRTSTGFGVSAASRAPVPTSSSRDLQKQKQQHNPVNGVFQVVSAKSTKILEEPNEALGKWIRIIFEKLTVDWSAYAFHVKAVNNNTELLIQFEKPEDESVTFPPPHNALNKYFMQMAKHGLAADFGLNRRGDRWNMFEIEEEIFSTYEENFDSLPSSPGNTNAQRPQAGSVEFSNEEIEGMTSVKDAKGSSVDEDTAKGDANDALNWYVSRDGNDGNVEGRSGSREEDKRNLGGGDDSLSTAMSKQSGKERLVKKRKYVLVFSFYPPWVGSSATNATRHLAQRNRNEARIYMQKKKERSTYFF